MGQVGKVMESAGVGMSGCGVVKVMWLGAGQGAGCKTLNGAAAVVENEWGNGHSYC